MKVVHLDELSMSEQRIAPAVAGRAATRRRRSKVAPPSTFSDGYEILTVNRPQQAQQVSKLPQSEMTDGLAGIWFESF
jgi:hypothetical protein